MKLHFRRSVKRMPRNKYIMKCVIKIRIKNIYNKN